MQWEHLIAESQLEDIIKASSSSSLKGILLFKHSTRCSISSMAIARLEKKWNFSKEELPTYYLDLLNYRSISNKIAIIFGVLHQSPQVLIVKNGKCVYAASHSEINVDNIRAFLNQ